MATGLMAFPGTSAAVIHDGILETELPLKRRRLIMDFQQKLDEIIEKALEKGRKLRYQSAADIRTDLQRRKRDTEPGGSAAETGPWADPPSKKNTWIRLATIAVFVVLVAAF